MSRVQKPLKLLLRRNKTLYIYIYIYELAVLAEQAYLAAERHDLRQLSEVSDRLDAACTACHHHYGLE